MRIISTVGLATLTLGLAACGASSGDKKPAVASQLSAASVKTLLAYTGGKAGAADPKKPPVVVGFINQEGGAISFPALRTQANAFTTVVNRQLGGIDGHPLKLVPCAVAGAEEQGQRCGQQFVNDDRIRMVLQMSLDVGNASFHAAADRKKLPIVGALPVSPADATSLFGRYTQSGVFAVVPDYVRFVETKMPQVKTIALVNVQGEPTSTSVAALVRQGFENVGIKVQQSAFQLAQTDVTGPLAAAGASKADLIVPLVLTPPQCSGVAKTLRQLNLQDIPVLALYGCATEGTRKLFGGDLPKWIYGSFYASELAPPEDAQGKAAIAAYNDWFKPLADAGDDSTGIVVLQTMLAAVRHLTAAGPTASRAKVLQVSGAWKGPNFLGAPQTKYGSTPSLPALPNLAMRFYRYKGGGTWEDAADGRWVTGELGEGA